ncbi:MAG TPA: PEP-utilizing enzyme [bacterium]|jgi:pyruvate,water dikinase|nr:PEP-utilizing enzyme [bacterium]
MTEDFPVSWEDPSDRDLSWEWDDMHMPGIVAPLAGDYARLISDGISYRLEHFGVPIRVQLRILNGYVFMAEQLLVPESDLPRVREQAQESRRVQARVVRSYWDQKVFPALGETYEALRGAPVESAPLAAIASLWEEQWVRWKRLWGMHFMTNAGAYQAMNELADLYESVVENPHPGEALSLVQGVSNDLQRTQRDLFLLAEKARTLPAVADLISRDPAAALDAFAQVQGGAEFLAALRAFLDAHGHLGQPFDDLAFPSWEDNPALLLAEVRKRLADRGEDPEILRLRQRARAESLVDRMRERLRDRPEVLQRFEDALALALDVGPLTEGHNYWLDRMLQAHAHRFAVRVGRRLVEAGVLAAPAHIFFLHSDEVGEALRHPRNLRALIAQRRAEHQRWGQVRPPRYLGRPPQAQQPNRFEPPPVEQTEGGGLLRGIGASPGVVRGRARIALSSDDFERVGAGDVLVCPSSNPSWVPLFGIIAGLVTNTGGALSHAAVVAREFGVPAVVGTGEATRRVRDGQLVEVDGTAGEVRLL